MRSMEMSAKTVEAAVQAACEALGVDRDDINVSYEVLEFPTRKLFKTIPAKVLVKVEEPEAAPAPAAEEKPAEVSTKPAEVVEISDETAPEIEKAVVEDMVEAAELAPVAEDDVEIPLDIAADPRLQAAVDYLTPIFNLMGVENFSFTAVKKGAATILKVSGEHMGALIGRRGETMESLSYLASLVVNRMEGPYIKLGLDVGGYRNKREDDLSALAKRIADRVIRTGCYYEMEPMNPYERHIIHTAIADIEGVRSGARAKARPAMWCFTPPTPTPATCPIAITPATSAAAAVTAVVTPAVMETAATAATAPEAPAAAVTAVMAGAAATAAIAATVARATAARVPACPPATLPTARVTRMPSRWPPKPPSASTTVTILRLVRSSFKRNY